MRTTKAKAATHDTALATTDRREGLAHIPVKYDQVPGDGMPGALREYAQLYGHAAWASEGKTVTLGEYVSSGGNPESAHLVSEPPDDMPTYLEMERTLRRLSEVYRRRLEGPQKGWRIAPGERNTAEASARKAAVLAERWMDPTAVALMYDMTTEGVRKMRIRAGLDPQHGVPATDLPPSVA
ncbi:MAG: hypothetical protein JST53_00920 [Actinobacteria bacterium]|nr:hypothetical protein [Actinomycetota bacterium]